MRMHVFEQVCMYVRDREMVRERERQYPIINENNRKFKGKNKHIYKIGDK